MRVLQHNSCAVAMSRHQRHPLGLGCDTTGFRLASGLMCQVNSKLGVASMHMLEGL